MFGVCIHAKGFDSKCSFGAGVYCGLARGENRISYLSECPLKKIEENKLRINYNRKSSKPLCKSGY